MTIAEAKNLIREDVANVLRLTRALLSPETDAAAIGQKLDAVMKPLAKRIREANEEKIMKAAFDELVLEDMRARHPAPSA